MFGDATRRPALNARLGMVEGGLGAGEFYSLVDVAMLQL